MESEKYYRQFPAFNPLVKRNLGKSVAEHLLLQELQPLTQAPFLGAGIYAIYYGGDHPWYSNLAENPNYIGKAVPQGARKGGGLLSPDRSDALFQRLIEHSKSLKHARNLDESDFSWRFLVVDDIWIPLAESMLIEAFKPLWNHVIEGFGIHDPGIGRKGQKRSVWDTLHPGRPWADKLPENPKSSAIEEFLNNR